MPEGNQLSFHCLNEQSEMYFQWSAHATQEHRGDFWGDLLP